jgi:hypothetical protein
VTTCAKGLALLIRDYGYRYCPCDAKVYSRPIRRFDSERFMFQANNAMDAAERLIPIIASEEYHARYTRLTAGAA